MLIAAVLLLGWAPAGQAPAGWTAEATPQAQTCPPRTKDNRPAIDPAALVQLERCLQHLPQTKALHWSRNGYDATRQRLHARILTATQAGARCVGPGVQPLAVFTAGPPGAGKSTWLNNHAPNLMGPGWLRIDADALRAQLPEYRGWNSEQTHAETGDLVNALLAAIGKPCRANVIYDGTMSHPGRYLSLIPRLKQLGYRTFIIQVMIPESLSRQRALERYQRSGRYVPNEAIESYYASSATTFAQLKNNVDGTLQVDGLNGQIITRSGQPVPFVSATTDH